MGGWGGCGWVDRGGEGGGGEDAKYQGGTASSRGPLGKKLPKTLWVCSPPWGCRPIRRRQGAATRRIALRPIGTYGGGVCQHPVDSLSERVGRVWGAFWSSASWPLLSPLLPSPQPSALDDLAAFWLSRPAPVNRCPPATRGFGPSVLEDTDLHVGLSVSLNSSPVGSHRGVTLSGTGTAKLQVWVVGPCPLSKAARHPPLFDSGQGAGCRPGACDQHAQHAQHAP